MVWYQFLLAVTWSKCWLRERSSLIFSPMFHVLPTVLLPWRSTLPSRSTLPLRLHCHWGYAAIEVTLPSRSTLPSRLHCHWGYAPSRSTLPSRLHCHWGLHCGIHFPALDLLLWLTPDLSLCPYNCSSLEPQSSSLSGFPFFPDALLPRKGRRGHTEPIYAFLSPRLFGGLAQCP